MTSAASGASVAPDSLSSQSICVSSRLSLAAGGCAGLAAAINGRNVRARHGKGGWNNGPAIVRSRFVVDGHGSTPFCPMGKQGGPGPRRHAAAADPPWPDAHGGRCHDGLSPFTARPACQVACAGDCGKTHTSRENQRDPGLAEPRRAALLRFAARPCNSYGRRYGMNMRPGFSRGSHPGCQARGAQRDSAPPKPACPALAGWPVWHPGQSCQRAWTAPPGQPAVA